MQIGPGHGLPDAPIAVRARRWRVKTDGLVEEKARKIQKCVVPPGVAGRDYVVLDSPDIRAHLEGMPSLDVSEVITFLVQVIPVDSGRAVIDP